MTYRTFPDRAADHPIATGVIAVLAIGALSAGGWAASVAFSDIKGQGDAVKQINSGTNRIDQYDHFMALDKDIRSQSEQAHAAQAQLDAFAKQFPPSPSEGFQVSEQRTNLQNQVTGPQQQCVSNVNEYNNDAKAYTSAKFRDSGLPALFDVAACTDPSKLPPAINN